LISWDHRFGDRQWFSWDHRFEDYDRFYGVMDIKILWDHGYIDFMGSWIYRFYGIMDI